MIQKTQNQNSYISAGNISKEDLRNIELEQKIDIRNHRGINLLPRLTKVEIQKEQKKSGFNLSAAVSIFFFVLISLGFVGFALFTRLTLNDEKAKLFATEKSVETQSSKIASNNEILQRIDLYRNIEEETFSPKTVLEYWQSLSEGSVAITNIELTQGLDFAVTGNTSNLTQVARLWHYLSRDEKVLKVNLESVSKGDNSVRFKFIGELNVSYFKSNQTL